MIEIAKLRARLKNAGKNVTEYRMTVIEAKALLNEIDNLLQQPEVKTPGPVAIVEHTSLTHILDGGTF